MNRIVVAGASLAGVRAAEALRREGFAGDLTLVGEETHFPPYDRPPLSKEILKGLWEPGRGRLKVAEDLNANLRLGVRAAALHVDEGQVELSDGSFEAYDGLVVATGATPRMLPTIDASLPGVYVLRTYDECLQLREALEGTPKVAIIGAGWIGCEVAATCRERGLDVTVIEFLDWPMERTLGPVMGEWAAGVHRGHGVDMRLGVGVAGVSGEQRAEQVDLADGTSVRADVVIVAIGVVPETAWLEHSGLDISNGIRLDSTCRAIGSENIVGAGDVARWFNPMFDRDMRIEHWSNAVEQASAAAQTLMRSPKDSVPYSTVPYVWSDQYDAKIQYVGTSGDFHGILEGSTDDLKFVAGYSDGGLLVGALCVNSPSRMSRYKRFIATHPLIDKVADNLP